MDVRSKRKQVCQKIKRGATEQLAGNQKQPVIPLIGFDLNTDQFDQTH